MSMTTQQIVEAAKELDPQQVGEVIDQLLAGLVSREISPAWRAELDHRWAAYEANPSHAISLDELDRKIRRTYGT